jgi:hypothetical protein
MGTKLCFLVPRAPPGAAPPGRGVEDAFCWLGEPEISWRNWELFIVELREPRWAGGSCGVPVGDGVVVGAKEVRLLKVDLGLGDPAVHDIVCM